HGIHVGAVQVGTLEELARHEAGEVHGAGVLEHRPRPAERRAAAGDHRYAPSVGDRHYILLPEVSKPTPSPLPGQAGERRRARRPFRIARAPRHWHQWRPSRWTSWSSGAGSPVPESPATRRSGAFAPQWWTRATSGAAPRRSPLGSSTAGSVISSKASFAWCSRRAASVVCCSASPRILAVRGLADGVVDPRRIGRIAPGRFELPSRGLSSACSADPEPRITGPRPHRGHDWPLDHGALIAIQRRGRILTFLTAPLH